jgi:polar amino acid transport system substrate-binding protein
LPRPRALVMIAADRYHFHDHWGHAMRTILSALILGCAALAGTHAARADVLDDIKARGTLIVGTKADYKPFGFRDSSGAIVGIEPDLAADIAKRLGVKLELVPVVSSNRMQFLDQGKIDLMVATMNDTPERRKVVQIVDPDYYASGVNILLPKASGLKQWSDIKGKTVCMIQGSFYNKDIQETYGAEILAFKSAVEASPALKGGNCVGFVYDDTLIAAFLLEPEWADYHMPFETILEQPWGAAVKTGEDRLAKIVSDAIIDWDKTGLILAEEKKYGLPNAPFAVEMNKKYAAP